MQYTVSFTALKNDSFQLKQIDIFIFAQNIDCGYVRTEGVLTSSHNLCFRAKIMYTPVLQYKSGV